MPILPLTKFSCPPAAFAELSISFLSAGKSVRFGALGDSMTPLIRNGDALVVAPVDPAKVKIGDVVFYVNKMGHALIHRVVRKQVVGGHSQYLIQADNALDPEGWVLAEQVYGRLGHIDRAGAAIEVDQLDWKIKRFFTIIYLRLRLNRFRTFRNFIHKTCPSCF